MLHCVFFFFQAEDGIRDKLVTGVQTCALPISSTLKVSTTGQCGVGTGLTCKGSTIGTDRKSVVKGKSVDLGGRRILKKKKKEEHGVKKKREAMGTERNKRSEDTQK